jgi:8-oxo-dGDP phosphatase
VAAMMEVLEESGFRVDVKTLLAVESAGGSWFRFVFTGEIVGGELKTPAQADKESIQAKFVGDPQNELPLRANDILPIIEIGRTYHNRNPKDVTWHKAVLPAKKSHHKSYLRLIIAIKKKSTNRVSILLSEKTEYHFPICELHPAKSVHSTLRKFLIELFGAELPQHRPVGLLSVEHYPGNLDSVQTSDGVCLTLLVIIKPSIEEVALIGKCAWHELSKELGERLTIVAASKNATIPLIVIR